MKITHEQEKLAREIASTLDDMDSISLHRQFVCTYSESYLRKRLADTMKVKDADITNSRGALYNHLVKSNGYKHRN